MDDIIKETVSGLLLMVFLYSMWYYFFKPTYIKGYIYNTTKEFVVDTKTDKIDTKTDKIDIDVTPFYKEALLLSDEELLSTLRVKSQEVAYYDSIKEVYILAYVIQKFLGENLIHFSSFNDKFHHNLSYTNKHTSGQAFDFTVYDPISAEEIISSILRVDFFSRFTVKNGYKNQFGNGQHFHIEIKDKEVVKDRDIVKCNYSNIESFIKCNEGYREKPYKDTKGNSTVCYGHNLEAFPLEYTSYTRKICEEVFNNDLKFFTKILNRNYSWWNNHPDGIKAIILDLLFNLGETGFAKFDKTLGFIKQKDYTKAANALLQNTKLCLNNSGNVTDRCKRQESLLNKGDF